MPFNKDDKGERTFGLGSLVKGAALAAPIGIGTRKWWQETDFKSVIRAAKQPVIGSPYSRAYYAAKDASAEFTTAVAGKIGQWNFVELNNTITRLRNQNHGLSAQNIKDALLRAAEISDPSGSIRSQLTRKLDLAQDPISVLEDINTISRTSSESIHMQRTVSSFLDNLNIIQQRKDIGKPLTAVSIPKINLWGIHDVQRGEISEQFLETINKIGAITKGTVNIERAIRTGTLPSEGELKISFFKSKLFGEQKYTDKGKMIPQLTLNLPASLAQDPNIVIHGATGQSKYIAGQFWNIESLSGTSGYRIKSSMKYEEWAINRFLEQHLPEIQKQQRLSRSAINAFKKQYHEDIMKPLQWIEDLPSGAFPSIDQYMNVRSQVAHLYGEEGRVLTDIEYANILKKGIQGQKVFPSASPGSIAKNVVSLKDWRDIEPFAGAFDWGKRPLQRLRAEYSPTSFAQQLMGKDPLTQRFSWLSQKYTQPSPMLRFAYVKEGLAAKAAEYGMNIEGSGLISRSKAPLFAQDELVRMSIKADQIYDLADILGDPGITEKYGPINVAPGRMLGYNLSGAPELVEDPFTILKVKRYMDKQKGDYFQIVGTKENIGINQFKAFGGVKGMMSYIEQEKMNRIAQDMFGFDPMNDLGINAIASIDELKKNRALHNKQMISALFDFTKQNMESGKQMGRGIESFMNNPEKVLAKLNKIAKENKYGSFDNDITVRNMMKLARRGKLTPQQMGGVFGAVPDVFGMKAETSGALREQFMKRFGLWMSEEEAVSILKGTPIGISQISYGGAYGPGSGKIGTIEPRQFELLSGPNFGKLGPQIQEEIATRMMARYPHRMEEQKILEKSLLSALSPSGQEGVLPSQAVDLFETGGKLNLPGIGDIYIPSKASLSQLSTYKTPNKMTIESQLAKQYESIFNQAIELEHGRISPEAMREELSGLASALHAERVGTVTGASSLLRGRLPGSRFLTAMPKANVGKVSIGRGEVGITSNYFEMMARDLEKIYGKEQFSGIKRKFLAGGTIGGMVARHPFIGPYSTAAVGLKMIPGRDARAVLGEDFLETEIMDRAGQFQSVGRLRYGAAIGMAADYDADIVNVMLASPNTEGQLLDHSVRMADYEAYSIRAQLMKAQKAKDVLSLDESIRMSGAALKLRIPQEKLGLISETLQESRAAVLMNQIGLDKQRQMNALGLLEWLEQTPISAKHIASGEEVNMISLLENIRGSISRGRKEDLVRNIRSITGTGTTAERMLEEDVVARFREGSQMRYRDVKGIKLEQAVSDILGSNQLFKRVGSEGMSPARYRQLMRNKGSAATAKEMEIMMKHPFSGVSAFSGFITHSSAPGRLSQAATYFQAIRNNVATAGGKLIEHAKPIGLGFAAAVGISAVFSKPPTMIGEIDQPVPSTKSGSGGANLGVDMEPAEIVRGRPTMNTMETFGRRAMVSPGTSVNIEASSHGNVDYNQLNTQLSSSIKNLKVQSRIVDNRMSLTAQKISGIIEED